MLIKTSKMSTKMLIFSSTVSKNMLFTRSFCTCIRPTTTRPETVTFDTRRFSVPRFQTSATFCTSVSVDDKDELKDKVKISSYLCVPPSLSQQQVAILTPYFGHLDLSPEGIQQLNTTLQLRGMPAVDLQALAVDLERRAVLRAEMKRIDAFEKKFKKHSKPGRSEEISSTDIKAIRADAKFAAQSLRDLEETLMTRVLALPNEVHEATPLTRTNDIQDVRVAKGHSSNAYYEGTMALAELAVLDYFSDIFAAAGFEPFYGPGLCRPVVVEGCGMDFSDPQLTFHLQSEGGYNYFHLVGSASLGPFCAYLTKCSVPTSLLPLRLFATGRSYKPSATDCPHSSRLHFFTAVASREEEDETFESCIQKLISSYVAMGFECRRLDVAAEDLSLAESRRTQLQAWLPASPTKRRTVADVSSCGEYISRRLWMCRQDHEGKSGFLKVVHGTAVSVPELFDCLSDGSQTTESEIRFPEALLNYIEDYRR